MGIREDIDNILREGIPKGGIAVDDAQSGSTAMIIRAYGEMLKAHDEAITRLAIEVEKLQDSRTTD